MTGRRYIDPAAERPPDLPCPVAHAEYGSEQLAENAAYLHLLAHPACLHIVAFVHADHWHIGHDDRAAGEECRAVDERTSKRARVRADIAARGHGRWRPDA